VILLAGTRTDAERLRAQAAAVLLPMGLRLSEEKTKIVHIDEGFDFLGMHIQRHKKRGAAKRFVYTYPSRAALAAVKAKVRNATRGTINQSLADLLNWLNPILRGWTSYHRHGAASATFSYLTAFTWRRVWIWLRHKYPKATVKELRRRYLPGWHPQQDETRMFYPDTVAIVRYRYRGTAIPSPWATKDITA
jgi:RNA-directed DNA polymerase